MTTIRLDAATLAKFREADGRVLLCDEAGTPVRLCDVRPVQPPGREPQYTEEEWRKILSDPRRYTTAEVLEKLRGKT